MLSAENDWLKEIEAKITKAERAEFAV